MLTDFALVGMLHARHAWRRFAFWMYATGADPDSRDFMERLYGVYILALIAVWALLMWGFATFSIAEMFTKFSADELHTVVLWAQLAPVVAFALMSSGALMSSPLKFTTPDIGYVAGSPISTFPQVVAQAVPAALKAGGLGAALGFFLGAGMSAAHLPAVPGEAALFPGALSAALVLGAWVLGMVRLAAGRWFARGWWVVVWPVALAVLVFNPLPVALVRDAVGLALTGGALHTAHVALAITLAAEFVALALLSPLADIALAVDESSLFAATDSLRLMRFTDPAGYAQIVRRKRLARRRPRFGLPIASGALAPVSRAVLSYSRQLDRLISAVAWGGLVVAAGVVLIATQQGRITYVPWIAIALTSVSAELTRIFREDVERPTMRQALPFGNLALLLLDSAPAIVVAIAASVGALHGLGLLRFGDYSAGVPLAVLLTLLAVLCRGIGLLGHRWTRRAISYEVSMFVALVLVALAAMAGGLGLATLAALVEVGVAAALVSATID